VVLALVAQKGWCVYQLDMKNTFLHGELNEVAFADQPQGLKTRRKNTRFTNLEERCIDSSKLPELLTAELKGTSLKRALRNATVSIYFFIKTEDGGKILIISLYVDDLIFTGNNEDMFVRFKESMKKEFSMSDFGKIKYFLGVEVI